MGFEAKKTEHLRRQTRQWRPLAAASGNARTNPTRIRGENAKREITLAPWMLPWNRRARRRRPKVELIKPEFEIKHSVWFAVEEESVRGQPVLTLREGIDSTQQIGCRMVHDPEGGVRRISAKLS